MTVNEICQAILAHYDTIASDVGEIDAADLIDHWVGQGNSIPPTLYAPVLKSLRSQL